jgi:hypothetical protein
MCKKDLEYSDILIYLNKVGELEDDNYSLVSATIDDGETEDEDFEAMLNATLNSVNLSAPGDRRELDSVQDTDFIKVRYKYVQGSRKYGKSKGGRAFCRAMEGADRLYRKEDILKMKEDGVNSRLGHNGQPYSLWLHKGGVNCYHKFERRIYVKRSRLNGEAWGGNAMNGVMKQSQAQAKKKGFSKYKKKFKNDKRVAEAQIDRSDKGHHPSYQKGRKSTRRKRR